MHTCIRQLTSIGSDNGLLPGRRQAVIKTNAGILLIWPLGTNFSEIFIEMQPFLLNKMHLKMSSAKWRPFCCGLNVLFKPPSHRTVTTLQPWWPTESPDHRVVAGYQKNAPLCDCNRDRCSGCPWCNQLSFIMSHRTSSFDLMMLLTTVDRKGYYAHTWWRHQMETFFALLALCAGNSPVTDEFPSQWPVMRSFDVFSDLCLNKPLSKQSWGSWFEMPSHSLWLHCNVEIWIKIGRYWWKQ